jgi:hypothetical protein
MPYGILRRNRLDGNDAAAVLAIFTRHLTETRWFAGDQIITQVHEKRFIADDRPGAENSVAEAEGFALENVGASHTWRRLARPRARDRN